MRIRHKTEVTCKECNKIYLKRTDALKDWSGLCRSCDNKLKATNKPKKVKDRFCKTCNVKIFQYNKHDSCKECWNKQNSGENHYNWQGGINPINKGIRGMDLYKKWRFEIFKRDNFKCTCCESNKNLNVDHLIPLRVIIRENNLKTIQDAELCKILWDLNNGRTLCLDCHKKTETYAGKLNKKLENVVFA